MVIEVFCPVITDVYGVMCPSASCLLIYGSVLLGATGCPVILQHLQKGCYECNLTHHSSLTFDLTGMVGR